MSENKPLVNGDYLLKKYPGKGGWTYAEIPEIAQNKKTPFGWVKVKGSIDGFELKQFKLMPNGKGQLFLSVKASIRKKIKKEAGDDVHVILYLDDSEVEIPQEIKECFELELPQTLANFLDFPEGQRKAYLDWIYQAKTEETKTNRIVEMMTKLQQNLKFYDRLK